MLPDDLTTEAAVETAKRGPGRPTLTNEELLDTALDIFLEKGFERTSIDAITSSAGMAKRTVYMRYGDKSGLFKAALQRAIEEWIVPIETLRAAETDDFEETLVRIGEILVANVVSPAGLRLLRITNAESARMPEISAYAYQQGTQPTLAYLADLFRRRAPAGTVSEDADDAALAYLYLVVAGPGSSTAWGVAFDLSTLEQHVRYCVKIFLYGLHGPRQGTAASAPPQGSDDLFPAGPGFAAPEAPAPGEHLALHEENRRLRNLLVESMLEVAALRERCAEKA